MTEHLMHLAHKMGNIWEDSKLASDWRHQIPSWKKQLCLQLGQWTLIWIN